MRAEGWLVLAEGGNQGAAFRYSLGSLVKAPDVVALRDAELLVAEGKLRARNLMIAGSRGISDLEACQMLACDQEAKTILAREAARRCAVSEIACSRPDKILVLPILFAHHFSAGDLLKARAARVPLFAIE